MIAKVSVVMPLYNAEKYVKETIESVINQSYKEWELIIVNDASIDESVRIIESFHDARIKLFHNERNRGIAYTRNKAIELSSGKYVALMDDDDIAPACRLEKTVQYLDDNADIDVVGGHCRFIDEKGNIIKNKQWNVYQNPLFLKAWLLLGDPIPNSSALIRKKFIQENKLCYRDGMQGAEDYRFWVECSLKGKIANIDEILLYWRTGHDNETSRVSTQRLEKRKKALCEIRKYALEQTGFQLSSEEIHLINKIFDDEGSIANNKELEFLFVTLKKISLQAKEMNLENEREITTMCRKRFGEKVGKAFYLWE